MTPEQENIKRNADLAAAVWGHLRICTAEEFNHWMMNGLRSPTDGPKPPTEPRDEPWCLDTDPDAWKNGGPPIDPSWPRR